MLESGVVVAACLGYAYAWPVDAAREIRSGDSPVEAGPRRGPAIFRMSRASV